MHKIQTTEIISSSFVKELDDVLNDLSSIVSFLKKNTKIDINTDKIFVQSYERDWSNIPGYAEAVARPINDKQCAILLYLFSNSDIPITISAGKTNLTGSATPKGGLVISTELMINPPVQVDINSKIAQVPVCAFLEDVRNKILKKTNHEISFNFDSADWILKWDCL